MSSRRQSDPIQIQDEILQILYWMRGEHLSQEVSLEKLNRFLGQDAEFVGSALRRLEEKGLVVLTPAAARRASLTGWKIRLSEAGVGEGRRRFEDEFEGRLGHDSHLVCDDPNCDCHDPEGDGYCHAAAAH